MNYKLSNFKKCSNYKIFRFFKKILFLMKSRWKSSKSRVQGRHGGGEEARLGRVRAEQRTAAWRCGRATVFPGGNLCGGRRSGCGPNLGFCGSNLGFAGPDLAISWSCSCCVMSTTSWRQRGRAALPRAGGKGGCHFLAESEVEDGPGP
jgi:hypothetical protein